MAPSRGYWHSAASLNYLRSYTSSSHGELQSISFEHPEAKAIGSKALGAEQLEFFTSHEAMQLDLEEALTRKVQESYYNLSAHLAGTRV